MKLGETISNRPSLASQRRSVAEKAPESNPSADTFSQNRSVFDRGDATRAAVFGAAGAVGGVLLAANSGFAGVVAGGVTGAIGLASAGLYGGLAHESNPINGVVVGLAAGAAGAALGAIGGSLIGYGTANTLKYVAMGTLGAAAAAGMGQWFHDNPMRGPDLSFVGDLPGAVHEVGHMLAGGHQVSGHGPARGNSFTY
jgi:hypothetical protein